MSAIAGVISPRHAVVRVTEMLQRQAHRGPDGSSIHSFETGAFGHAGLHTTHESIHEPQPVVHHPTGVVVTGDVRIDNRRELCALLGHVDRVQLGDAELALSCYLRWGSAFASRLLGAFAIALWDPRAGQLIMARDHFGVRPLYYSLRLNEISFASSVDAVAAVSGLDHVINLDKAVQAFMPGFEQAEETTTSLEGVAALPRASTLAWTVADGVRVASYWSPEPVDLLRLPRQADYVEAASEALDRAVTRRTRSAAGVASMLSGGLDSTAVVASVARRSTSPAHTVSAVLKEFGDADDTPFIHETASVLGLETRFQDADNIVASHDLNSILRTSDSLAEASQMHTWAMVRLTAQKHRPVLLTGVGGDELFALSRAAVVRHHLSHKNPIAAISEAPRWEGSLNLPIDSLRVLGRLAMPNSLLQRRTVAQRIRRIRGFAARLGITEARTTRLLAADRPWQAMVERVDNPRLSRLLLPYLPAAFGRYERIGARMGVEIRHPFADKELVEFCLSLPASQLHHRGWSKSLLRQVVAKDLPDSIAYRPKNNNALGPLWATLIRSSAEEILAGDPDAPVENILHRLDPDSLQQHELANVRWDRSLIKSWLVAQDTYSRTA